MEDLSETISKVYEAMIDARQHYKNNELDIKQYVLVQHFLTRKLREIDPFFKQFIFLGDDDPERMKALKLKALKVLDLVGYEKFCLIKTLARSSFDPEFSKSASARLEEIEEERRVLLDTISEINLNLLANN